VTNNSNRFSNDLNNALEMKDMSSFWRSFHGKFKKDGGRAQVAEGCCSVVNTAGVFAIFFQNSCFGSCSVLFLSHPRSKDWPHHGRTFPIYLYPLSF